MDNVQIIKRGGGTEPWSYDKLVNSMAKAGLDLQKAEELATQIENWAKEKASDGKISSNEVRDKVLEVLKNVDTVAADSYNAYKKV